MPEANEVRTERGVAVATWLFFFTIVCGVRFISTAADNMMEVFQAHGDILRLAFAGRAVEEKSYLCPMSCFSIQLITMGQCHQGSDCVTV